VVDLTCSKMLRSFVKEYLCMKQKKKNQHQFLIKVKNPK
jgi:hypothetical protein